MLILCEQDFIEKFYLSTSWFVGYKWYSFIQVMSNEWGERVIMHSKLEWMRKTTKTSASIIEVQISFKLGTPDCTWEALELSQLAH
jgi:hypothetical protein